MAFFNAPPWRGPASDHFDGKRFRNSDPKLHHATGGDLLKWTLNRESGPWTRRSAVVGPAPLESVSGETCRVTLVGHATLLVQLDGLNFLTDPVWADRIGPMGWVGPKRYRNPAIRFEDLPPIHLVLLSHNHYDHMCLPTLKRIAEKHGAPVVTGLGNAGLLERNGVEAIELDWWEETEVAGVRVTGVEMQHFSGRGPADRDVTLWMGLVVHHPAGQVLFCGDTGYGEHFRKIRQKVGAPRLALIPIGAYRPRWFMRGVHVNPHEAVLAHQELGAETSVGMHYGTFRLADDGMEEAVTDLIQARRELDVSESAFRVLEHGIGTEV